MTDDHLSEDVVASYADDPGSVADRRAVDEHLALCSACASEVEGVRAFIGVLREEETWWLTGDTGDDESQRVLREFIRRSAAEDAEAEQLLEPLLKSHYRFTYANIARKRRYQTGGVVRLLCRAAWDECAREPLFALTLAENAAVIAEALPDDYYPARAVDYLRGTAWKEASTALRLLGKLDEAFEALKRAERAYRRLPDGGVELATVELCRATLEFERDQFDKALEHARSAAMQFAERRESRKFMEAKEVEGFVLHSCGDLVAARERYAAAYQYAETNNDVEMKARAATNLARADRDGGNFAEASKHFAIALQLYAALGQPAMVAHVRWSVARLALLGGNASEAAERLPAVVRELVRFGMSNFAAHARLDLAEALLVLGRHDEVESICSELIAFYRQAEVLTGALTAAAYLKEAAAARRVTRDDIEHVRRYLAALERSPDRPFAPPPHMP